MILAKAQYSFLRLILFVINVQLRNVDVQLVLTYIDCALVSSVDVTSGFEGLAEPGLLC